MTKTLKKFVSRDTVITPATPADDPQNQRFVLKEEAARVAGVSVKTLERWHKAGVIRRGTRPSTRGGTDQVLYWLPSVLRQTAKRAQDRGEGLRVPAELEPPTDAPGAPGGPASYALGEMVPAPPRLAPADPMAFALALVEAVRAVSHPSETMGHTSHTGPAALVDVATFAALAGLPQADIRDLIADGTLPHRTTRRGGIRLWAAHVALLEPKATP